MLTDKEIDALIARIARALQPDRIVLFGSYAKGRATARSDVDLMIVLDTELAERYRAALVAPLIGDYSVRIDAHIATPAEVEELRSVRYSFMDATMRTGRVMYDRDARIA